MSLFAVMMAIVLMLKPVTDDDGQKPFAMPGKIRHVPDGDETTQPERCNRDKNKQPPDDISAIKSGHDIQPLPRVE